MARLKKNPYWIRLSFIFTLSVKVVKVINNFPTNQDPEFDSDFVIYNRQYDTKVFLFFFPFVFKSQKDNSMMINLKR